MIMSISWLPRWRLPLPSAQDRRAHAVSTALGAGLTTAAPEPPAPAGPQRHQSDSRTGIRWAVRHPGAGLSSRAGPGLREGLERGGQGPRVGPAGRRGTQERQPVVGQQPGPDLRQADHSRTLEDRCRRGDGSPGDAGQPSGPGPGLAGARSGPRLIPPIVTEQTACCPCK